MRRCLAKDPAARIRCAADLAFALETFGIQRMPAPPSRLRRLWAPALVGGLVAAVALGWVVWPSREVDPAPRYTRITFHHRWQGKARFAPEGRTVVYESAPIGESPRIFAATPGRPEARPLTEPGTRLVAVSATGEMLLHIYTPDGKQVIARAPLSGGVPRVVYDDVDEADFSPDGSELAIVRRVGGLRRLEYPVCHALFTTPYRIASPRISPRCDQVAFVLWDSRGEESSEPYNLTGTIEVVGRDGTRRTLGQRWREVIVAAWSPDAREVWVSGRRGAFWSIFAIGLDGHERTVLELPAWLMLKDVARDGRVLMEIGNEWSSIAALVPGSSAEIDLGWHDWSLLADLSADGRMVLFGEGGEASQARNEAYVRKTDGSPAVDLGAGTPLALSPDGAWALVGPPEGLESSLALVPIGPGERRPLPAGPIEHYRQAYFFADGQRIAIRAREAGNRMRVWVQDIAGGDPRPITDAGIAWLMRPAPNGEVVPACRGDGSCALYPTAGGEPRPLPRLRAGQQPLQLTADGQSLVVVSTKDWLPLKNTEKRTALWLVDAATGRERLLRDLDVGHGVLSTYVRVTPDATGYAYSHWDGSYDLVVVEGLH